MPATGEEPRKSKKLIDEPLPTTGEMIRFCLLHPLTSGMTLGDFCFMAIRTELRFAKFISIMVQAIIFSHSKWIIFNTETELFNSVLKKNEKSFMAMETNIFSSLLTMMICLLGLFGFTRAISTTDFKMIAHILNQKNHWMVVAGISPASALAIL